jgi:glycyl-tRNA synthetase beta chain
MSTADLLFEIGCEELPASFVEEALLALPVIARARLGALRLAHGAVHALGTPRRLALFVEEVAHRQADLEEALVGPPAAVAFKDGAPTPAAKAFAKKLGCAVEALGRTETPKGVYLTGTRRETGRPALEVLPAALADVAIAIPFRKSMRWGAGSFGFGRPIRWLVALLGEEIVPLELGEIRAGSHSFGHRFLHPGPVAIPAPRGYRDALRAAHVLADPAERRARLEERLRVAAADAGGELIEDAFLLGENLSLVEEPHVVAGGFDGEFLALPEVVILAVARGHQRYFGVRGGDGRLLARYLAVVNTAERPDLIRRGNDRVMRARLADARFFFEEDRKRPLADRRERLGGIVFQARLGTVADKVARIERLVALLGPALGLDERSVRVALRGAALAKCDLVTWMVGELPELEGEIGRAYALLGGEPAEVADVVRDHYRPKGAADATAPADASALVAIADRLDTLVGCFAVGLEPSGSADPYGLRRACLGVLRTALDRGLDLRIGAAVDAAHAGFAGVALDRDAAAVGERLGGFFRERLRGLFAESLPADAVDAALAVAADRPLDARARAEALASLEAGTRERLGEVFKRATNIAKEAPAGAPDRSASEPSEHALYDAFFASRDEVARLCAAGEYVAAAGRLATLAPVLHDYFATVFVMADDARLRDNRLRLMRAIRDTCALLARLELLGAPPG